MPPPARIDDVNQAHAFSVSAVKLLYLELHVGVLVSVYAPEHLLHRKRHDATVIVVAHLW